MLPLQKSQLVLENIIQYSFDEIFVTDQDGNIIYSSDSFKNFFGIDAKEIINQNVFVLEKDGILSPSVIGKVLKTKKIETIIQETTMGRKIVVSGYPIINDNQELLGALSFSRDITELDYLKKTNDQVAKIMLLYEEEIKKIKRGIRLPLLLILEK